MQPFETLGSTFEATWRAAGYDELVFPALAARALREARIHEQVSADDILRWLLKAEAIPQQHDIEADFAEPPVTVYHGRRFQVQVLFWFTGSTTIHDHAFSGAFQVLEGSSVQSRYEFHQRRRISSRFLLGEVRLRQAELLQRGDVVEIDSDLIHSVFHLAAPSVTVVLRTYTDHEKQPQYDYHPPSLAVDPFHEEPVVKRWLQALALMIRAEHQEYEALATDIIGRTDVHTCYKLLDQAYRQISDPDRVARLVQAAQERHGPVIAEIAAALRQERFRRKIFRLRSEVRDHERRFFLALLQNLPDRDAIYSMVRRHYPDSELREQVVRWVHSLSGSDRIGVDFEDELNCLLFEALLDGCSGNEIRDRLKAEFDPDEVDAQSEEIDRYAGRMQQTVLAPLLRRGT